MESSVILLNSNEASVNEGEEIFLRSIPTKIRLNELTTDALRLLVYYVSQQGPYDLAVESGYFQGNLVEWLQSLRSNLSLKYSVKYYNELSSLKELTQGDLVFVKETNLVYVYNGASFPAKKDGISLTGLSTYQLAVKYGFKGSEEEWVEEARGTALRFEDLTEEEKEQLTGIGKSAYELAIETGFEGSVEEWLESLKGVKGLQGGVGPKGESGRSAYQIAVDNGYEGSEESWTRSLQGLEGKQGLSAYELSVLQGFTGDLNTWLESLKGISAYQMAILNGFKGTQEEWLESLAGSSAYSIAISNGFKGTEEEWLESLIGKSAYELALDNGFKGTEATWLNSLTGKSAYLSALEQGFVGSEEEWLNSLKGTPGKSAYDIEVEKGYEGSLEDWIAENNNIKVLLGIVEQYKNDVEQSKESVKQSLNVVTNLRKEEQTLLDTLQIQLASLEKVRQDVLSEKIILENYKKDVLDIKEEASSINIGTALLKEETESFAKRSEEALLRSKEVSSKIETLLENSQNIVNTLKTTLTQAQAVVNEYPTYATEIESKRIQIEASISSFKSLINDLQYQFKSDVFVLTEDGGSQRTFNKSTQKSIQALENNLDGITFKLLNNNTLSIQVVGSDKILRTTTLTLT